MKHIPTCKLCGEEYDLARCPTCQAWKEFESSGEIIKS